MLDPCRHRGRRAPAECEVDHQPRPVARAEKRGLVVTGHPGRSGSDQRLGDPGHRSVGGHPRAPVGGPEVTQSAWRCPSPTGRQDSLAGDPTDRQRLTRNAVGNGSRPPSVQPRRGRGLEGEASCARCERHRPRPGLVVGRTGPRYDGRRATRRGGAEEVEGSSLAGRKTPLTVEHSALTLLRSFPPKGG